MLKIFTSFIRIETLERIPGTHEPKLTTINPIKFALVYERPAIAIYNLSKLRKVFAEGYVIKDPTALIAIIRLKNNEFMVLQLIIELGSFPLAFLFLSANILINV